MSIADVPTTLGLPASALAFGNDYLAKGNCSFKIRCHDRHLREATVTDVTRNKLFVLSSTGVFRSWNGRRSLKDATGKCLWDLKHEESKAKHWIAENDQGEKLCTITDSTTYGAHFTTVEAQIPSDRGDTLVSMRSFDREGTKTIFQLDGATIAELLLSESNNVDFLSRRGLDRTVWNLRVAEGVDIGLILALTFCRCEISHIWHR